MSQTSAEFVDFLYVRHNIGLKL